MKLNRTTKTILLLGGALAVVFLLMNVDGWISDFNGGRKRSKTVFERMSREIPDEWKVMGRWDRALFDSQVQRMNDAYSMGNLKKRERNSLLDLSGEWAWRTIDTLFKFQMAAPNSDRSVVDANKKGLDYLKGFVDDRNNEKKTFENSEHIGTSLAMYGDYDAAMKFAKRSFNVSPEIDADFKWSSFSSYQSSWDKKKKQIENSPYFASHFRKIDIVSAKWRDYDGLVRNSRTSFHNSLSQSLPQKMSQAFSSLQTSAESARQQGKQVQGNRSDPDYGSAAETAKQALQSALNQLNTFFENSNNAKNRFEQEVGSGSSASSSIATVITRASRERMETEKVINDF